MTWDELPQFFKDVMDARISDARPGLSNDALHAMVAEAYSLGHSDGYDSYASKLATSGS